MSGLVLSPEEIVELAKRVRFNAQARQLEHMRIPFERRTDGSLVVLRVHVDALLKAVTAAPKHEPRVRLD
jgi:hypothetical protein